MTTGTKTRPTVSVVVPHYFEARKDNLATIGRALAASTVVPEQLLIWDNTEVLDWESPEMIDAIPFASVITSPYNVGAQARFLAALMATGDEVLFLDNDVCPDSKTIENLLDWRQRLPQDILTLEGRHWKSREPYGHWSKRYGHGITSPEEIGLSLGRGELVRRKTLPAILARFPFAATTVMDDLWFSACAARAGVPILLIPCVKGVSSLGNLPTYGTGLCTTGPVFYQDRDAAVLEIERCFGRQW